MKILVELDLDRPLLRGTKISCSGTGVWVEFKYKNLAMFCHYYGRVGHHEKNCWELKRGANRGQFQEDQFGDWLKADVRRLGPMHFCKGIEGGKGDKGLGIVERVDTRAGERGEAGELGRKREMVTNEKMKGTVRDRVIDGQTSAWEGHEGDSRGSDSMSVARIDLRI